MKVGIFAGKKLLSVVVAIENSDNLVVIIVYNMFAI